MSKQEFEDLQRRIDQRREQRNSARAAGCQPLSGGVGCQNTPQRGKLAPGKVCPDGREADLHEEILAECTKRGWIPEHGSMVHRTKRRVGELDFCIPIEGGRTLWVECKTRTTKTTVEQNATIAYLQSKGHSVTVVRSLAGFLEFVEPRQDPQHVRD